MVKIKAQSGVALLVSLVILLVLTLLAVSSMQGSLVQERMASAQRDAAGSLEAAELALYAVEDNIEAGTWSHENTHSFMHDKGDEPSIFDASTWEGSSTDSVSIDVGDNREARVFLEYLGDMNLTEDSGSLHVEKRNAVQINAHVVRVVVMGRGPSGSSRRFVESFYVYQ
ncbi:pilus assembly PilX family protein [Marinobacter salexigens]|uniref:pilus assembly PilX family protein n=1 Tax=Marinobacter salexigens TaxID=1925763 RepID=UPI000C287A45|nr:PilX N-terminal domain-containing pilus assembly protein [Marinobacter salexigens]